MKLKTLAEAESELRKYIPLSREVTGRNITLKRMRPLMAAIGNPENKLRVIHIAGTSGKTSTTYYIAALLTAAGKKTGMTVSPHIDSVTERIQINMKPIKEALFCEGLSEFLNMIKEAKLEPTYFELLIGFAYWYFVNSGVDYAVVETGLGGLGDGTNVAARKDKLCVITDIGLDHINILGKSLPEIAAQKAGIIHEGNEVLMYDQGQDIQKVFESRCRKENTHLHVFVESELRELLPINAGINAIPGFQQRNWLLAYVAYQFLETRDEIKPLSTVAIKETMKLQVPARMDKRNVNGKTIIMDGAHNQQKMEAFVTSFRSQYPGVRATVMLSMKEGKEYKEVLPLLQPISEKLIICGFSLVQDTPLHSSDAEALAAAARDSGIEQVIVERDPESAYRLLLAETGSVGIITGSFYLIGELRRVNKELQNG